MNPSYLHESNPLVELFTQHNAWDKDQTIKRNEFVKSAGSKETHIYFVLEGALRVFYLDDEQEHSIRFAYRHNFITLLDSLLSQKASSLNLQAIKKTIIKTVSYKKINELLAKDEVFAQLWFATLGNLVQQQMEREIDLLTSSPLIRYQRVLKRSPQLFQEIPNRYIASYLRMSPETLSRIKKLDLNQ